MQGACVVDRGREDNEPQPVRLKSGWVDVGGILGDVGSLGSSPSLKGLESASGYPVRMERGGSHMIPTRIGVEDGRRPRKVEFAGKLVDGAGWEGTVISFGGNERWYIRLGAAGLAKGCGPPNLDLGGVAGWQMPPTGHWAARWKEAGRGGWQGH
jgi:hypothetical protein